MRDVLERFVRGRFRSQPSSTAEEGTSNDPPIGTRMLIEYEQYGFRKTATVKYAGRYNQNGVWIPEFTLNPIEQWGIVVGVIEDYRVIKILGDDE